MKRYYIHRDVFDKLNLGNIVYASDLKTAMKVTPEMNVVFKHIPRVCVSLSQEMVDELRLKGYRVDPEHTTAGETLSVPPPSGDGTYEKERSMWYQKVVKDQLTGKGVKVAVIDSGFGGSGEYNPTLVGDWVGYNFVDDSTDVSDVYGSNGHGTGVISIIKDTEATHPDHTPYMYGIAPGCELHVLKVYHDDLGTPNETAILAALEYCIDEEIDFINMSFAFGIGLIPEMVEAVLATNCILIAATGNRSTPANISSPACLPGVIAVNALKADGTPGHFNYLVPEGDFHGVDISCSGVDTERRSSHGNIFIAGGGTSYSAPFMTAACAIYKERLGEANNRKVVNHILEKALKRNHPATVRQLIF